MNSKTILKLVIVFIIGLMIYGLFSAHQQRRETNQRAVVQIMNELNLGSSQAEVERMINIGMNSDLKLKKASAEIWFLETPLVFGANNWILILEFQKSGLTALKMRTPDSVHIKPQNAPGERSMQN